MKPQLRVFDTGVRAPDWNVARTAELVDQHTGREIGDTLRFHRYEASVLLGHGQIAEDVADIEYCRRHAVAVVRRITGGGAVLMLPGMLAWEVVTTVSAHSALPDVARCVCTAIAHGLVTYGVAARFSAPHDIQVNGRKISGSSGYVAGRSAVLQGTILLDDDTETMAGALRLPIDDLRRRVTCLRHEAGRVPPMAEVMRRLADAVADALGQSVAWIEPDRTGAGSGASAALAR